MDDQPPVAVEKTATKDDHVEVAATFLGSFVLGASFGKDFFLHGRFEVRMFLLGVSGFVLFLVIAVLARIRLRLLDRTRPWLSASFAALLGAGNIAAFHLFVHQFVKGGEREDIRVETILFLLCYTAATNMLFALNRGVLFATLQRKTIYKYLLAPINGLSAGTVITAIIVQLTE